jgi:hypothetical protein
MLCCVVFKVFAFFGLSDHVHLFMAIDDLVCLMASHEWKDSSQVLKSQIIYLSSIPWIIFVKIFFLGISSIRVWTRLIWKDSIIVITPEVETLQVQRNVKWKDFIIIFLIQGLKWNEAYLGNHYLDLQILLCQGMISHHLQATYGRLWKIHLRNLFNISFILFHI